MNENSTTKAARGLLLVCMILSLGCATLSAQTRGDSKDWDVTTQAGELQDVVLSAIIRDTLYVINPEGNPALPRDWMEPVPVQDVLALHRGHAGHIVTGTLIGLGVGILVPAIWTRDWHGDGEGYRVIFITLGGAAGTILGFLGGVISSALSSEDLDLSNMSVAERTEAIQHVILFDELP